MGKEAGLQAELFLLWQVIVEEAYRRRAFRKAGVDSRVQGMGAGGTEKKGGTQMQDRVLQDMKSYLSSIFFPNSAMNVT